MPLGAGAKTPRNRQRARRTMRADATVRALGRGHRGLRRRDPRVGVRRAAPAQRPAASDRGRGPARRPPYGSRSERRTQRRRPRRGRLDRSLDGPQQWSSRTGPAQWRHVDVRPATPRRAIRQRGLVGGRARISRRDHAGVRRAGPARPARRHDQPRPAPRAAGLRQRDRRERRVQPLHRRVERRTGRLSCRAAAVTRRQLARLRRQPPDPGAAAAARSLRGLDRRRDRARSELVPPALLRR